MPRDPSMFRDPNDPRERLNPYSNLANETRAPGLGAQTASMGMYRQQAQGQGPSLAGLQLQQGLGQAQGQTLAAMGAGRGGNMAAQQAGALSQGGALMGQINQQAALQRAAEQQAAQQAYAGLGTQLYSQGFGYDQLQNQSTLQDMENQLGWYQAKAGMDLQEKLANDEFNMNMLKLGIGAVGQATGAMSMIDLPARNLQG